MSGPEIRAWRLAQGWTQAYAAGRLGVSRSTLHLIERGDTISSLAAGRVASVIREWGDRPPADTPLPLPRKRGRPRNHVPPPSVERIRAEIRRNPRLTDADLARLVGVSRQAVGQMRARWAF
jgi:DNA-binding XRE family transcriptional regulator